MKYLAGKSIAALLATGLALVATPPVHAQGTINFSDFAAGAVFSHIYAPQPDTPGTNKSGNSATPHSAAQPSGDFPVGTNIYQGLLLGGSATGPTNWADFTNGSLWTVQLWTAAGSNQPVSQLQAVPQYTTTMRTGPTTNAAGFFAPVNFSATNTDAGIPYSVDSGCATCQLRVWYNGGGLFTNWLLASGNGVPFGFSAPFTVNGLGLTANQPPPVPANLAGLQSFSINTPEAWVVRPYFYTQPASQTVPVGSNAVFAPNVCFGLYYQWQLNGTNLMDGGSISGSQTPVLTVSTVTPANAGVYTLVMANLAQTNTSAPATLTVAIPQPVAMPPALNPSTGTFALAWNVPYGQQCQVQFQTNLGQTNWLNLGGPILVTNGVAGITDQLTNTGCFYRLLILPAFIDSLAKPGGRP